MPRRKKTIESSLEFKGFLRTEGDHHYFVYITQDGLKTRARTKTSHSPKVRDVADNLLGQMARQCFLPRPDFLRLVDCSMDREEYERRLIDIGEIEADDPQATEDQEP